MVTCVNADELNCSAQIADGLTGNRRSACFQVDAAPNMFIILMAGNVIAWILKGCLGEF